MSVKVLEQKEREYKRLLREIRKLDNGNPQQQRKCARLKEQSEKLKQEIQKLQDTQKEQKQKLEELKKKIQATEGTDKSKKRKRRKLEKEYEALRKTLGIAGEEFKESERSVKGSAENGSSRKKEEKREEIDLEEQHPAPAPAQRDQYGIYRQVRAMDEIEQQMIKRKKIETEAGDAFTVRAANLRELEADLDGSMKQVASPIIHKYEQELRQIRKKSSRDTKALINEIRKLEKELQIINKKRELCATTMAEMNLTTKRVLFDLIGWAVSFLRNTLYILARIRDIVVYYAPS